MNGINNIVYPGRENTNCRKCKLYLGCTNPFISMQGSKSPKIMIVSDFPGTEEDRLGKALAGINKKTIFEVLRELDIDTKDVAYTNVIRCRPEEGAVPKKHITYCADFAISEIEKYSPKFVLLMGNTALNGILGEYGISNWNGIKIKKDGIIYIPLYHPSYVLKNKDALDDWLSGFLHLLPENEENNFDETQYIFPETLEDMMDMKEYLSDFEVISYDTETSSLDPYKKENQLLACSFSCGDGSVAYGVQLWHRESILYKLSEEDQEKYINIIRDILTEHNGNLVGHNIKYDILHTNKGLNLDLVASGDTMLLSHLINSMRGIHGLKRLAGLYLGMYQYEAELDEYKTSHPEADPKKFYKVLIKEYPVTNKNGKISMKRVYDKRQGSYANIPLNILLPYAAMDAEATIKLDTILYNELSDSQKILYEDSIMPVNSTITAMQDHGLPIDKRLAFRYLCIYKKAQHDIYEQILEDKRVKRLTKSRLKDGWYNEKTGKVVTYKTFKFNPNSSYHVADLFYKYYKLKIIKYTEKNAPSVDKNVLAHYKDDYPIVGLIRYYKLLDGVMSKYLRPAYIGDWNSGDGICRTNFNQHGTVSGRLSSNDPNAQNIPTPEKEPGTLLAVLPIKNIITHPYVDHDILNEMDLVIDRMLRNKEKEEKYKKQLSELYDDAYGYGVVMSIDYSGMELRVFSAVAHCLQMIDIHKSGKDFHSMVALMSLLKKPVMDVTDKELLTLEKSVRYRYKWTNWTLLYGGDEHTLHRLYDIPLIDAIATVEEYYKTFPEVLEYKEDIIDFVEQNGYVESPFGRRIYFPSINSNIQSVRNMAIREAINGPIQSAAGELTLMAMYMVGEEIKKRKLESRLINTVHDSIVLVSPITEVEYMAKLGVEVMENIRYWASIYMPRIDFSWLLDVPLKADVDVGDHYGNEVGLEKWLENDGYRLYDHYYVREKRKIWQ